MTASNQFLSAGKLPHEVMLSVHKEVWLVLYDNGLKFRNFVQKLA